MDIENYFREYIAELSKCFSDREKAEMYFNDIIGSSPRNESGWETKLVNRLGLVVEVVERDIENLEILRDVYSQRVNYRSDNGRRLLHFIINKKFKKYVPNDWHSWINSTGGGDWSYGQRIGKGRTHS